jgi:hypothetical protein
MPTLRARTIPCTGPTVRKASGFGFTSLPGRIIHEPSSPVCGGGPADPHFIQRCLSLGDTAMFKRSYLLNSCLLLLTVLFTAPAAFSQVLPGLDKSPADIAYFRNSKTDVPAVKVIYSRPQKKDRRIFGGLVPYNEVWRTGANEATEITFTHDGTFGGKAVKAGRYSLFTIPGPKSWTIILNSALDVWGSFTYDKSKDVLRVEAPVGKTKSEIEAFTIFFTGKPPSGNLVFAWDNVWVEVPVSFK